MGDATKVILVVAVGLILIALTALLGIIFLVYNYDLRDTVVIAIVGIGSSAVGGLGGLCLALTHPAGGPPPPQ
jgi:hypothetical protein